MQGEDIGEVLFDRSKMDGEEESELTHNEIWDDSLLIQHYDETMNKARQLLATKLSCTASSLSDSDCSNSHRTELVNGLTYNKSHSGASSNLKKKKRKKGRKKNEWHTGDPCKARYSEDGQVYEATIIDIDNATATCTVRYLGYNNLERVAQSSLLKSKGEGARKRQLKEATEAFDQSDETSEASCAGGSDVNEEPPQRSSQHHKTSMPPPRLPDSSMLHSKSESRFPHLPELPPPPALGLVDGSDPLSSEALHTMLMSWYMTGYHTGYYQGLNHSRKFSHHKKPATSKISEHPKRGRNH